MSEPIDLAAHLRRIPAAAALPENDFTALTKTVYTELEYRVGTALSVGLTNAQLLEFEALIDYENTHPGLGPHGPATAWLNTHRPHHTHTVFEIFTRLLAETTEKLSHATP